ncbi:MAG: hypothetical protein ACKVTZ_12025 [Bacteroidia bacterium]
MRVNKLTNLSAYQSASYFTHLFSKAVQEAKEINHKHGLPNDFVLKGERFYELPNGVITTENPLSKGENQGK